MCSDVSVDCVSTAGLMKGQPLKLPFCLLHYSIIKPVKQLPVSKKVFKKDLHYCAWPRLGSKLHNCIKKSIFPSQHHRVKTDGRRGLQIMYLIMNYMHIYIQRERNLYICREREKSESTAGSGVREPGKWQLLLDGSRVFSFTR